MKKPTVFTFIAAILVTVAIGAFAYIRGLHELGGNYSQTMGVVMTIVAIIILMIATWLKIMEQAKVNFLRRWEPLILRIQYNRKERDEKLRILKQTI